jgi:hypothetical protein
MRLDRAARLGLVARACIHQRVAHLLHVEAFLGGLGVAVADLAGAVVGEASAAIGGEQLDLFPRQQGRRVKEIAERKRTGAASQPEMQLDLDRNAPVVRLPQCHRVIQPVVKIESVADIVGHHIWATWKGRHRRLGRAHNLISALCFHRFVLLPLPAHRNRSGFSSFSAAFGFHVSPFVRSFHFITWPSGSSFLRSYFRPFTGTVRNPVRGYQQARCDPCKNSRQKQTCRIAPIAP